MARKIKLGWKEQLQDSSYGTFADAAIGHEKIDFDLPYEYEMNNGSVTIVLKGQILKFSGKGLSFSNEKFHNVDVELHNVSLRWMRYEGRIFTYAFLYPTTNTWGPFVFMARIALNLNDDVYHVVIDDTSVWRRIH